jgi:uncharacterized LabA/DUF88 family protein
MKTSIFIDGGFLKSKYRQYNNAFPTAEDVAAICNEKVMGSPQLKDDFLFRIHYYDCHPYAGHITDPATGETIDYSQTPSARAQDNFLLRLSEQEKFFMQVGELVFNGWRLPPDKIEEILSAGANLSSQDLIPDFRQKQVDINIGLDIAWLATTHMVDKLVLIAGDSDLTPAMAFARRHGLLVYLATLGQTVKQEMIRNSDGLINIYI